MKQLKIYDVALPEVWAVGKVPEADGIYKCRVKLNDGDIIIRNIECKNNMFLLEEGKILAWR